MHPSHWRPPALHAHLLAPRKPCTLLAGPWGIRTPGAWTNLTPTLTCSHHPTPTCCLQALGENALLARALCDACGTAARVLGPRLPASGRALRSALLPLLGRLADPCALVSAAASTALASVCTHCGYKGSLGSLVAANADYIVDSLCAQLRELGEHPRAPSLLAALLRRGGGVAPALLPLMAEPLGAALRVGGVLTG